MYSARIEKAIQTAGSLHASHDRKGPRKLPYITHLFSVALLVRNYIDDEDVFIAALLHDSIEDTPYTPEELEDDFGPRVKAIVLGVTEPQGTLSWAERKRLYIKGLQSAPRESLYIAASDKIHNFTSVVEHYRDNRDQFWNDFSGTPATRLEFYQYVLQAIASRLDSPILDKLERAFEQYKTFLTAK